MTEQTLTEYTPTEWATAEDKAKWEKKLKNFILKGCKDTMFNKPIYTRLSMMFGHIAHYDKHGFYAEWFSNPTRRLAWLNHIANKEIFGSPTHTWSDVEKSIQRWVIIKREQIEDAMTGTIAEEREFKIAIYRYINRGGTHCLACDSMQLEGSSIDVSAGYAKQDITCLDCGSTWEDIYKLRSIDQFEKGDEQP